MHRLDFIKLNMLAGLGLNFFSLNQNTETTSTLLLTGREKPKLSQNKILDIRAYQDFQKMHKAALKDGINISVVSGYRHFSDQLRIWNRKYQKYSKQNLTEEEIFKRISAYSAIPGTSRHHWGTEIDIIDTNAKHPNKAYLIEDNYKLNGVYHKLYTWMLKYGEQYGFYLVYTDKSYRNGFKFEPWHYSYKPLSQQYLKHFSRLNLEESIKDNRIRGNDFLDKKCLLSYFHTHLLGINPLLLP